MNCAAVIVTFNRLEKLKETVARTVEEPFSSIIIVNNASTDGTAGWLDSLNDDRLIVKHLKKNTGGAGGFHHGFKAVVNETDAKWLVCFDDDAHPEEGTVEQFSKMTLREDVASIAAAVYLPNGEISEMNRPRYNPFWHFLHFLKTALHGKSGFYVSDDDYISKQCIPVDASTFVGYFIRCSHVVGAMGLPRSELFIYADDLIYSMQARQNGFRHLFCPRLRFIHDCDTLTEQKDIYTPYWKIYYTYRNRIEMYRQGFGVFFYPMVRLQFRKWKKMEKHYDRSELFQRLLMLAYTDAMKQDFTRAHEEILALTVSD